MKPEAFYKTSSRFYGLLDATYFRNYSKSPRKKAQEAGAANLELLKMDAAKLEFNDKSFDKILLSLVLHEADGGFAGLPLRLVARERKRMALQKVARQKIAPLLKSEFPRARALRPLQKNPCRVRKNNVARKNAFSGCWENHAGKAEGRRRKQAGGATYAGL